MSTSRSVTVKLLDKEYTIGCPDGAEAELLASADYLNDKMRDIRSSGKIVGLERIAVIAALNISYELVKTKDNTYTNNDDQLLRITNKIDQYLSQCDSNE